MRFLKSYSWIIFFVVGVALLGYWSIAEMESRLYQKSQARMFEEMKKNAIAEKPDSTADREAAGPPAEKAPRFTRSQRPVEYREGGLVGRIEIPRLKVSAMIVEGVEDGTLKHAVGHVPKTALPGQPGNVGLAAHRDSFFRGLKGVALKDTIEVSTLDGNFAYAVDSTLIVTPDRVDVLDPRKGETVTLVTCYPFNYIGHAPERFIVFATRCTAAEPSTASLSGVSSQGHREGPEPPGSPLPGER